MLFLLRQIRRKMLSKNKITTYLLYAIGEIVLVVVGILIAVSIDDWNQDKKQKGVEKEYMHRLKEEFQANKKIVEDKKERLYSFLGLQKKLIHVHQSDSAMAIDELISVIERSGFAESVVIRNDVWNDIYSTGNALIFSNIDLQERMSKFYNNSAPFFEQLISEITLFRLKTRDKSQGIIPPITRMKMVESWIENKFPEFLKSTSINEGEIRRKFQSTPEIGDFLVDQIMITQVTISRAEITLSEIELIIEELDREIEFKN